MRRFGEFLRYVAQDSITWFTAHTIIGVVAVVLGLLVGDALTTLIGAVNLGFAGWYYHRFVREVGL